MISYADCRPTSSPRSPTPDSTRRRSTPTSSARSRRTCPAASVDTSAVATISADATRSADFAAREPGIVAGLGVAAMVFHYVMGDDVEITDRVPDGTPRRRRATSCMRVAGPTRGLLTAERTALNFASHLSGVATATVAVGPGARGHRRPGARHPQDAAGLAGAPEVRRPLRRRRQPSLLALRHGDGQGQPRHRRRRGRARPRGRARGLPGPPDRGRGDRPRPAAASSSTPAATGSCSTTCPPR